MRSMLVQGSLSGGELAESAREAGVEVQAAAAYELGTTRVEFLIGKRFYFRSNDYLGLVVVAATDGAVQRIDVGYAGGGSGLLGVQWGAGNDLESTVYAALLERLRARSLPASDVPPAGRENSPLPSSGPARPP